VVALERLDSSSAGLAFAVPRRVGPAVVRNRLRRQLRAAASELERRHELPVGWFLVIVSPGAVGQPYPDLGRSLAGALVEAARRASGDVSGRWGSEQVGSELVRS